MERQVDAIVVGAGLGGIYQIYRAIAVAVAATDLEEWKWL